LLITGPGVTNAATPIGEAYSDSVPLLVLSSVNATRDLGIGRGELHEITDQEAVTRPLTGFSATVLRPEQAPQLLARAFASFASQRPRPAHIQIPLDVMEMPAASGFTEARLPNAPAPDAASVEAAVGLLRKARRPVLLVGGGAVAAGEAVRALAERLDAPVVTTIAGKGIIPDSHPLSLGAGLQRAASRIYLAESDLVLVVGSELATTDLFMWGAETHKYHEALGEDHPGPGRLGYTGGLVRIDIDADTLTRDYEPDVAILGDARQTLERIGAALADDQPAGRGARRGGLDQDGDTWRADAARGKARGGPRCPARGLAGQWLRGLRHDPDRLYRKHLFRVAPAARMAASGRLRDAWLCVAGGYRRQARRAGAPGRGPGR
jgi:thiamine pyrophosphate-dependent acetolactate synthase large subunit-like protein